MYKPNQESWEKFPKEIQLGNIGAELARATKAAQREDEPVRDPKVNGALERALALIDASINDPKWANDTKHLRILRDAVASLYVGNPGPALSKYIYTQLMLARPDHLQGTTSV